ncbi:MAG: 2OG-Fe(II) oxygenase [Paracoccaceae bacterium]|nr:2OG-Fe(II) oxygenase [Paracoccaceae bacterium]
MQYRLLNANPFVAVYDDVFDEKAAEVAIKAGEGSLKTPTYGTPEGRVTGEKRTNLATRLNQWDYPELTEIATKISTILRLPPENCETSKLLRYEGEQLFDVHQDGYDEHGTSRFKFLRGGQRLYTSLCYLNTVEEGGQTAFPNLKIAVKPKLGRVLIFGNCAPGKNTVHPDSAHVGFGPDDGLKWVLTMWWREHHYHIPRTYPPAEGEFLVY